MSAADKLEALEVEIRTHIDKDGCACCRTPEWADALAAIRAELGEAVPVEALRELVEDLRDQARKLRNEVPNRRDGTDKRFYAARDCDLFADELTALSGPTTQEEGK